MTGLCLVKVSNNNADGPFGGVLVVQMSNSTTARAKRDYVPRAEDIMF